MPTLTPAKGMPAKLITVPSIEPDPPSLTRVDFASPDYWLHGTAAKIAKASATPQANAVHLFVAPFSPAWI